jgi:prefoldin subunit 5
MAGSWDKPQAGETAAQYQAFCRYRDLGPGRTLEKAHAAHVGYPEGTRGVPGRWRLWCDQGEWRARCAAYDAHLEREARQLAERETIKRRAAMLKRHQQAGELLTSRGVEFFVKQKVESARDAIAAVGKGVDLERQAEGLPDWVIEVMNAPAEVLDERIAELECRRRAAFAGVPDSAGDALSVGSNGNGNGKH